MIGSDSIWLSELVPLGENCAFAPPRQSSGIARYRHASGCRMLRRTADNVGVCQIFFEAPRSILPTDAMVSEHSVHSVNRRPSVVRALSALFGTGQVQAVHWLARKSDYAHRP
jgi:hypothetical protein